MNDCHHHSNHRKRKSNHRTTLTTDDTNNQRLPPTNMSHTSRNPADTSQSDPDASGDVGVVVQQQPSSLLLPFVPLRQLRLEAIFYPKFENEQPPKNPSKVNQSTTLSTRDQMIERCLLNSSRNTGPSLDGNDAAASSRRTRGYIEVSIKHSGSLVLWSGESRYYSKNSTDNVFTHTCELLLRQHFYQWSIASTVPTSQQKHPSDLTTTTAITDAARVFDTAKELYNACSQYIVQNRLTLSFEVVTSVLGDHGARPKRDYILLTAIADRNRVTPNHNNDQIFYTTIEIIEFAQKFHLPHNDYWIYNNELSIQQLFQLYDTSRETGTTSTILPALTNAATYNIRNSDSMNVEDVSSTVISECEYYIQSMYPHAMYQGEILEGIVIRFVQYPAPSQSTFVATDDSTAKATNDDIIEQIKRLSRNSRTIVQQFTKTTVSVRMEPVSSDSDRLNTIFTINLRGLYDETKALHSKEGLELFKERVRKVLQESSDHRNRRTVFQRVASDPSSSLSVSKQLSIWIDNLLQQQASKHGHSNTKICTETYKIAKLLHDLSQISKNVTYTIYEEIQSKVEDDDVDNMIPTNIPVSRYICIVHVLHDQTFHKYHRSKGEADLPLFRGFSFELIGVDQRETTMPNSDEVNADIQSIDNVEKQDLLSNDSNIEDETLMLKMKFLPYMVRTFCCRNGLKVIRQVDGITAFVNFTNNLMSKWGLSDTAKLKWRPYFKGWAQYAQPLLRSAISSEHMIDLPPLSEYAYLDHLQYYTDLYDTGRYRVNECSSRFQGLVVIVAPKIESSGKMADYIAQRLGGAQRRTGMNDMTPSIMEVACTPGQGIVCNVTIDKSYTTIRKHILKDFEEFVSIILLQCNDVMTEPRDNTSKELVGYLKGWKSTRGARNIEIPDMFDPQEQLADDSSFQPSSILNDVISQLELPVVEDSRPGLLIFFPTIPGSGKSSLVTNIDKEINDGKSFCDRKIYIDESDRCKGKFWPHISRTRRRCYSAINIADKNAPTSAWGAIGSICAATKALAVPVLPDRLAFQTISVIGVRRKDGTLHNDLVHTYPFSLPYLAVCMTRVLLRPAGSHAGQLDQSNDRLCMIVVKFYSFYRNLSAQQLLTTISATLGSAGAHVTAAPIEVPFFIGNCEIKLPQDVEFILLEALRSQFGYEKDKVDTTSSKVKDSDDYLNDLEFRLRNTLKKYQDVLLGMTAEISDTRLRFVQSVVDKIEEVDTMSTSYEAPPLLIQLVAIDVERKSVYDILADVQLQNENLSDFLEQVLQGKSWESIIQNESNDDHDTVAAELGFVNKTHVTLAHYRDVSQSTMQSLYTPHIESTVELTTNAIYYNEHIMALAIKKNVNQSEVITSDGTILPLPSSSSRQPQGMDLDFLHITIWCNKGVSAVEANALPSLAEDGKAYRIEFPEQLLQGNISFWYL